MSSLRRWLDLDGANDVVPDVMYSSRGTDGFSPKGKEDYEKLQQRYLEKQVRTGDDAESAGGISLRRVTKPPKINNYDGLKKRLDRLKKQKLDKERHRNLTVLSQWEMNPRQYGGIAPTEVYPGNDDVIQEIQIDDSDDDENSRANKKNAIVIDLTIDDSGDENSQDNREKKKGTVVKKEDGK